MKELKNNIKIVNNGGSLSETDLQLIAGTELVEKMMRNRLVVVTNNNDIAWHDLMTDVTGLYHIRPLDKSKKIYQLWFETEEGKFIKQHSQTPIQIRVMNDPNTFNEKVELWATLEEKIETFWRLKFK